MLRPIRIFTTVFVAALLAAGCGGGGNKAANQNAPAATASASPAAAAPQGGSATTVAPVPAKLSCGGESPVWANTRTHVYHVASDPLYGRTKHGQYMCLQQARSAGYHVAGGAHHARKGHRASASPGAMPQPSPSP